MTADLAAPPACPPLQVLQRENLFHATCVVTPVLRRRSPGAGRGWSGPMPRERKLPWTQPEVHEAGMDLLYLPVPYSWYERMKLEVAAFGGLIRDTQFGADVELEVLLPEARPPLLERLRTCPAPRWRPLITGQEYRAFPLTEVSPPHLEIFSEGGYKYSWKFALIRRPTGPGLPRDHELRGPWSCIWQAWTARSPVRGSPAGGAV